MTFGGGQDTQVQEEHIQVTFQCEESIRMMEKSP